MNVQFLFVKYKNIKFLLIISHPSKFSFSSVSSHPATFLFHLVLAPFVPNPVAKKTILKRPVFRLSVKLEFYVYLCESNTLPFSIFP